MYTYIVVLNFTVEEIMLTEIFSPIVKFAIIKKSRNKKCVHIFITITSHLRIIYSYFIFFLFF